MIMRVWIRRWERCKGFRQKGTKKKKKDEGETNGTGHKGGYGGEGWNIVMG